MQVTENPQATDGCKLLGRVQVPDGPGDETKMRNMTAQMGGNLLYLVPKVHEIHCVHAWRGVSVPVTVMSRPDVVGHEVLEIQTAGRYRPATDSSFASRRGGRSGRYCSASQPPKAGWLRGSNVLADADSAIGSGDWGHIL